jgi:hypothetical protein
MAKQEITREKLLKKTLQLIKNHEVTAYEIEQHTDLTAVGVQKIINGETKNPQKRTLQLIIDYINEKYLGITGKKDISKFFLEKDGVKISVREMAVFFADNQEVFMQDNILKNIIDLMVEKGISKRIDEFKKH